MIKRRLAFATPFVLVAGCRAPAPASPEEDERTRAEEAPVVVTLPPPIDAPLADAPDLHLEAAAGIRNVVPPSSYPLSRRERCEERERRLRECCYNPPPPQDRTIRGRIIEARPTRDAGTADITIGIIKDHECDEDPRVDPKQWTAQILRGETDQRLDRGTIVLVGCDRDRLMCRGTVRLTRREIFDNPHVLMTEKK